jgi:prolyl-tRNA synthetase
MKQTQLFAPTMREVPADAQVISHQLMLRAGLMRQLTAGVYSLLPLGLKVLSKIEQIVREEMDAAGAQEVLLPTLQPTDLWRRTGRVEDYGDDMFRLFDRHQRETTLGPTHEEVITTLVANEIHSYRQLPVVLYQIQTKFRDEARPRAGLLRGREFRMKDAYSFEVDEQGLDTTYRAMYNAYCQVFQRIGVAYRAVEADAGAIGGNGGTHEFMVLSDAGEDTIVACSACAYAANIEKAEAMFISSVDARDVPSRETVMTPGIRHIDDLADFLGVSAGQIVKVVVYMADEQAVGVCLCGHHEVNEIKVKNLLQAREVTLATADEVLKHTGREVGFVGPEAPIRMLFDNGILSVQDGVVASKTPDAHDIHAVPNRDFTVAETHDLRSVLEGDACPSCGEKLVFQRGIEVGHVFKLGTKYSKTLNAVFHDATGKTHPVLMGCYGLGTSRLIPAMIEQCHDEFGIKWPIAVAPFHTHIVPINLSDEAQRQAAEGLYRRLRAAGVDVLLDDRDERPGVKFKDADLYGAPVRITVGKKISDGLVEVKLRQTGAVELLSIEKAYEMILGIVK